MRYYYRYQWKENMKAPTKTATISVDSNLDYNEAMIKAIEQIKDKGRLVHRIEFDRRSQVLRHSM